MFRTTPSWWRYCLPSLFRINHIHPRGRCESNTQLKQRDPRVGTLKTRLDVRKLTTRSDPEVLSPIEGANPEVPQLDTTSATVAARVVTDLESRSGSRIQKPILSPPVRRTRIVPQRIVGRRMVQYRCGLFQGQTRERHETRSRA